MTVKWSTSSSPSNNTLIRQSIIYQRKQLSKNALLSASQAIFKQIQKLNLDLSDKKVASYLPVNGEMNTSAIHSFFHQLQQPVYLPIIKNETLVFSPWNGSTKLEKNQFNILEPVGANPANLEQIDILFVPLVAFKQDGNRLGMGGGYYDKTLAQIKKQNRPKLIGLAHEFQNNENFETYDWDIQLDIIVTEKNVYFKKSA